MIGKLKGLVETIGDDHVLIDVNGVCYEAHCSARTLQGLPRVGEAAVLHIEMIVREDMIRLYGFASEGEKSWFKLLLTRAGGRVAGGAGDLVDALAIGFVLGDRIAGQGDGRPRVWRRPETRAADRDRTQGQGAGIRRIDAGARWGCRRRWAKGVASGNVADAVSALVNLGYPQAQASGAVARVVAKEGEETATEKLIRLGLRELSS